MDLREHKTFLMLVVWVMFLPVLLLPIIGPFIYIGLLVGAWRFIGTNAGKNPLTIREQLAGGFKKKKAKDARRADMKNERKSREQGERKMKIKDRMYLAREKIDKEAELKKLKKERKEKELEYRKTESGETLKIIQNRLIELNEDIVKVADELRDIDDLL